MMFDEVLNGCVLFVYIVDYDMEANKLNSLTKRNIDKSVLYLTDMVQYNDICMFDWPYVNRLSKLKEFIEEPNDRIKFTEDKRVKNAKGLEIFFMTGIDKGAEGIFIKNFRSRYSPGEKEISILSIFIQKFKVLNIRKKNY